MIKFFHRFASCLLACLILCDAGVATAFSAPGTRPGNLPDCVPAFGEQAVVAGLTEQIQSLDIPAHLYTIKSEADKLPLDEAERPSLEDLRHKIFAIHATKRFPKRGLVITAANRVEQAIFMLDESRPFLPTLHFSLGEMVQAHTLGSWEDSKYAVLSPLGALEPQLVNLNAYDSFIVGDFQLPAGSIVVVPENTSTTSLPSHVAIVRYRKSEGLRRAVDRAIQQAGGWSIRMVPTRGDLFSPAFLNGRNMNTADFFAEILAARPGLSFGTHTLSESGLAFLLGQIGIFLDELLIPYQPYGRSLKTSTVRLMHALLSDQLDHLQKSALLTMLPAPAGAQLQGEILKARQWLDFVDTDIHLRETYQRTLSRADAGILTGARNLRVHSGALTRFVTSRLTSLPLVDPAQDEPPDLLVLIRAFESLPAEDLHGFLRDHPGAVAGMNPWAIRLLYVAMRWCLIGPERAADEGLPQWLGDSVKNLLGTNKSFETIDFIAQIGDYLYADSSHLAQALNFLQQPAVHKYAAGRLATRFAKSEPSILEEVLKKHPQTKVSRGTIAASSISPELRELFKMTDWPEVGDDRDRLRAAMPRSFAEALERNAQIDNADNFIIDVKYYFERPLQRVGKDKWAIVTDSHSSPRRAWSKLGLGKQYRQLFPSDDLFYKSPKSAVDICRQLQALKDSDPKAGTRHFPPNSA